MGSSVPDPQDEEHLKTLALCHYILAAITAFFGSIPLIHVAVGAMFLLAPPPSSGGSTPPEELRFVGAMFLVIGIISVLLAWSVAVALLLGGRRLSRRQGLLFCQVVAGISCLMFPLGTALGVFTFIVLGRPSVRALFAEAELDR